MFCRDKVRGHRVREDRSRCGGLCGDLKGILPCLMIGLALLVTLNLALPQNTSAATLRLTSGAGNPGSEITLALNMTSESSEDSQAVQLYLNYDPAMITYTEATIGSAAQDAGKALGVTFVKEGRVKLVVYPTSYFAKINDGTIVNVTFTVIGRSTTIVVIDSPLISTTQGQRVPLTSVVNGVVNPGIGTPMSADENCQPKDVFNTRDAASLEDVWVAGTLPTVKAESYPFYLTGDKDQWVNGIDICSAGCVTSRLITIDSTGHFCGLLWTPPVGDNNEYDIVLDVNKNGVFDEGIDFFDSGITVGAATLIELSSFTATAQSGEISLEWETASELDNAGFNLWRSDVKNGRYTRINSKIMEARGGATQRAEYTYSDDIAKPGIRYYYKLEDIDTRGVSTFHGPISAMIPRRGQDKPADGKSAVDYYPPYWPDVYDMGMYSKPVWPPVYGLGYSWWPYYP